MIALSPTVNGFVSANAPRLWLLGLVSSLSLNLYKINRLHPINGHTNSRLRDLTRVAKVKELLAHADAETRRAAKDALQDLVDLVIPLSLMGAVDVSPGVVGLAGTFTSVLSLTTLWPSSGSK